MKRLTCITFGTLLLGFAILNGCGEKAEEATKKTEIKAKEITDAGKQAAEESVKSAVSWTKDKMDTYVGEMKEQLGKFDKQFAEYSAKAEKLSSEGKDKYKKSAAAAAEKKELIATKMKELQGASGEAWVKIKHELDKLVAELEQLYETIKTEEIISKKKAVGVKVGDIHFDYDTFTLKAQEKEELNQLGKFLQANPKTFVAVQGFTDNRGTPEYNMKLSRERAEAVTDYLTKNFNLDSGRVATMWYGEASPLAINDSAENRWKNRRVEIAVSGL